MAFIFLHIVGKVFKNPKKNKILYKNLSISSDEKILVMLYTGTVKIMRIKEGSHSIQTV